MKALNKFMTPKGECIIWMATSAKDGNDFYALMGKWFASKEVADALGEPLFDNKDVVWTLAIIKDQVIGFGGIDLSKSDKKIALLNYGFVQKDCRNTGIYLRLLEARIQLITDDLDVNEIRALCTVDSATTLAKLGFEEKSKRGRYTWFTKEVKR